MKQSAEDYTLHKVYVYIIYNCKGLKYAKSDDLFYVGQTKQPLKERDYSHRSHSRTLADKLISTHRYFLLEEELCFWGFRKDVDCMEKYLIKKLNSTYYEGGYGVNIELGGYDVKIISDEQRIEISKRVSGKNNPMYGRSGELSPAWGKCYKIVQYDLDGNFIKIWDSARQVEEVLGYSRGHVRAASRTGNRVKTSGGYQWRKYEGHTNPIEPYKKEVPLESKKKMQHPRAVDQYTLDGEYIKTFPSIKDAQEYLGVPRGSIGKCCQNKRKTSNGYRWKYHEDK